MHSYASYDVDLYIHLFSFPFNFFFFRKNTWNVSVFTDPTLAKIAGELKVSNVAAVHSYNYVYHNLLEIIRANKKKSGFC